MFRLQQLHYGTRMPLLTLYVDSLNTLYTYENVIVEAANAEDSLDVVGVTASCQFAGDAFPLIGTDYLSPVTGTLTVTITSALADGLYRIPLRSLSSIYPFACMAVSGVSVAGLTGDAAFPLPTALQIQVLTLPIDVAGRLNLYGGGKPTAWGGIR